MPSISFAIELPPWLPSHYVLAAVVGSGCAFALIALFGLARTIWSRPVAPPSTLAADAPKIIDPEFDPFEMGSPSEKRETFRRKGNPVRVLVRVPGAENETLPGCVVDRSSRGLALCMLQQFPSGSRLQVRPDSDATETSRIWLDLEVRSAQLEHGEWRLGCKWIETPQWNILLQFG